MLWMILNSNLFLIVVGFFLTTLLGTIINQRYQKATWVRTRRTEDLRRMLDKQEALIDVLSEVMHSRYYTLWRLLWRAKGNHEAGQAVADFEKWHEWTNYRHWVDEWNESNRRHRSQIRRLADDELATRFFTGIERYEDEEPSTIHGLFVRSHVKLREYLDLVSKPECEISSVVSALEELDASLVSLETQMDVFLAELDARLIEARDQQFS